MYTQINSRQIYDYYLDIIYTVIDREINRFKYVDGQINKQIGKYLDVQKI